jgi:hypothetical protein
MARNSQPAASLDPSDRANQPFMVMPTTASANADAVNRIGATRGRDGVTAPEAIVGGVTGVTGVTFPDSDRVVATRAATAGTLAFLRCLYARARSAGVLARVGRG